MKSWHEQGGGAFPVPMTLNSRDERVDPEEYGMSLRDWFAGQIMPTVFGMNAKFMNRLSAKEVATLTYEVADAMLEARKA